MRPWWIGKNRKGTLPVYKYIYIFVYIFVYIYIQMLLFIFDKMREPKNFLKQLNITEGVPLED